jgi:single-strand DNA-binding protein
MQDINKVTVTGRLTRDPETRATPSGAKVTSIRIAVNREYKVRDDYRKETAYIKCEAWQKLGEYLATTHKGQALLIDGYLQFNEFQGKDGVARSELVLRALHVNKLDVQKFQPRDPNADPKFTDADFAEPRRNDAPSGASDAGDVQGEDSGLPF